MKRLQKAAVIVDLSEEMRRRGSWCGETHLQKATYFLQELFDPELGFDFILYRHGPFSFDLRDELMALRADGLLALEKQPYPYGPRLVPTDAGTDIKGTYPRTLRRRRPAIRFVADKLGTKDVNQLERVATALYVTRTEGGSREGRARELNSLKPHVTLERALAAVDEVDEILAAAVATQAA